MPQNKKSPPAEPEQQRGDDGRFEKVDEVKSAAGSKKEADGKAASKGGGSKEPDGKSSGGQKSKSR